MFHLTFSATNNFDVHQLFDFDLFVENHAKFQSVYLNNNEELGVLLEMIFGQTEIPWKELDDSPFLKYANISTYKYPILDKEQFEKFLNDWLKISNRESNMDEYGMLSFLKDLSKDFNECSTRLILIEE